MLKDMHTFIYSLKSNSQTKQLSTIIEDLHTTLNALSKHIQFPMDFSEIEHKSLQGKCKTRNRHLPQKHRCISVLGLQIMSSTPYKR